MVEAEPLRERIPIYVRAFGLGIAAAVAVGLIIYVLSPADLVASVGYAFLGLGTLMLLMGGGRGGGYANLGLGALGTLARGYRHRDTGERSRSASASADDEGGDDYGLTPYSGGRDPMERLRRGLRPPPNPTAFWQVIGGIAYLGVGVVITTILV
jgi:hypothetical protein